MLRVPRPERAAVVGTMREAGMSTRAIGSAIGVDDRTVRRELTGSGAAYAAPATTTGRDGKTYSARGPVERADCSECGDSVAVSRLFDGVCGPCFSVANPALDNRYRNVTVIACR